MPIDKSQFDQDLADFKTALEAYIAAVNAFIALPPVVDLASEDDTVKAALAEVQAAAGNLPPPPPGP